MQLFVLSLLLGVKRILKLEAVRTNLVAERPGVVETGPGERPFGATECEEVRLRRQCGKILAELAEDVSEAEAWDALQSTISEAGRQTEERTERRGGRIARPASFARH